MNKSESGKGDPVKFIAKEISQVRKRSIDLQRQDMIYEMINIQKMKGMFSDWANLEAACDNTSDSLEPCEGKLLLGKYLLIAKKPAKVKLWECLVYLFKIIHIRIRLEWSRGEQTCF